MKNTLIVFLTMTTCSLFSQNHFFGTKGAVAFSKVTEKIVDNEFIASSAYGLTYDYRANSKLSLGVEALVSGKGFRNVIIETDVNAQPIREVFVDERFKYFSVPIKVGYTIKEESNLFVKVGVSPSFLLNNKTVVSGSDDPIYNNALVNSWVNNFDVFGLAEVGVNVKSFDESAIYSSISIFYGLFDLYESPR